MAKKSDIKPQKRTKCTKSAVKTAKKPVLRENLSADTSSDSPNDTPKKRGNPKGNPQNLVRYEKGDPKAKINGGKGGTRKGLNAKVLNETAAVVEKDGMVPEIVGEALKHAKKNPEYSIALLTVAEKAMKIVGATHDQSPDAKQNLNINADVKKAETVKLVIEDFTKPDEVSEGSEA